jgi:signal-transduction protein with cAMP-binding, CBS, and nucleotidyltransferase domain
VTIGIHWIERKGLKHVERKGLKEGFNIIHQFKSITWINQQIHFK